MVGANDLFHKALFFYPRGDWGYSVALHEIFNQRELALLS